MSDSFIKETGGKRDFNLEVVLEAFQKCVNQDENLVLEEYLRAFNELCRFFKLTGRILGFVALDLQYKIKCVEFHLKSKNGSHYRTVQSMIKYEQKRGETHKKGMHPSGCRMVLRLHYALEFILQFMDRLRVGDENEKISEITWDVYKSTLIHHHPWLTQKLAQVAVYALPSKKHLIDTMCKHDYAAVLELLTKVVNAGRPVYDTTQQLYTTHNLLNIP